MRNECENAQWMDAKKLKLIFIQVFVEAFVQICKNIIITKQK